MMINRRKPINKFIMRNLNILRAETSTQYNDLRGAVSIDFHNGITQLHDLCKDLGVDLEKYITLLGLAFLSLQLVVFCRKNMYMGISYC